MKKSLILASFAILFCGSHAVYAEFEKATAEQGITGQVIVIKDDEKESERREIKKAVRLLAAIGRDIRLMVKTGAVIGSLVGGISLNSVHPSLLLPGLCAGGVGGAYLVTSALFSLSLLYRFGTFTSRID